MRSLFLTLTAFIIFSQNKGLAQTTYSKAHIDSFNMLAKNSDSLTKIGKYDSALYYTNLLELFSRKDSEINKYHVLVVENLAELYRDLNKFQLAFFYYKYADSIYKKITIPIDTAGNYATLLCRLGSMNWAFGANSQSIPYFQKAIEIYKRANSITNYVQINLLLAEVYSELGEYQKSYSINSLMIATLDTLPKTESVLYQLGSIYNNIGAAFTLVNNGEKAIDYLKKSLEIEYISKKKGYSNDYDLIMLNLADLYASYKINVNSALKICGQLEDSLTPQNRILYLNLLKVRGTICQAKEKYRAAINYFKRYKIIADSLQEKPDEYPLVLLNLGLLYTVTKQFKEADSLFRNEIAYINQSGLQYSYAKQQSIIGLCKNLIGEKKYNEAIDSLMAICSVTFNIMDKNFAGMSESEKLQYENQLNDVFDLFYTCLYSDKNIPSGILSKIYILELKRKAWILNSEIKILNKARNTHDTVFLKFYNEWISNKQIIAKQYSLPYSSRLLNVDSLEKMNEILEKRISTGEYELTKESDYNKPRKVSTGNIEFIRFTYKNVNDENDIAHYAAFISNGPDGFPAFVHLCSEKDLLKILKNKKGNWINENQLTQNLYSPKTQGNRFYKMVWQPIEKYIRGVKTINYSTAGLLNNVAFPAINNGKTYLVHNYIFRRYFNLSDAAKNDMVYEKPKALNIWGNMDYTYSFAASTKLLASKETFSLIPKNMRIASHVKGLSKEPLRPIYNNEIAEVKKIFVDNHIEVANYEKENATEENFKNNTATVNGVLHISTHGFYTQQDSSKIKSVLPGEFISGIQNPLFRCGLAFAGVNYYWLKGYPRLNHDDGILTGYEISQLDLHNVQLVTLSACETGLGDVTDNEGNFGLQRAFKMAGVNTMLVSLWQVPAKQTAELLSLFYKNWIGGQNLSASLRNAEIAMAKKYPPYFWAGFVLIE